MKTWTPFVLSCLALLLLFGAGPESKPAYSGTYSQYAVASDQGLASEAGAEILWTNSFGGSPLRLAAADLAVEVERHVSVARLPDASDHGVAIAQGVVCGMVLLIILMLGLTPSPWTS